MTRDLREKDREMSKRKVYLHLGSMSLLMLPWWRSMARVAGLLSVAAELPVSTAPNLEW
jgi:hypothetical protein